MAALEPGDRLVVSGLSRLGRSLGEVVAIAVADVVFVAIKENIRFERQRDIQTKVMTTMFALRDLISERTREGPGSRREAGATEGSAGRVAPRRQGGRDPPFPDARRIEVLWGF